MAAHNNTYTPEKHQEFLTAVRKLGFVQHACAACRLDESKVRRWFARGRKGEEPYATLYADVKAVLSETIGELRAIAAMQPGGAKWLLSKMDQSAYGDRTDRGSLFQEVLDILLPRLPEHCRGEVIRVVEEIRRELELGEQGLGGEEEVGAPEVVDAVVVGDARRLEPGTE